MKEESILLANIGELITFIQKDDPEFNQIAQFVTLQTLSPLGAMNFFGATLEGNGNIRVFGQYGFPEDVMKSWEVTHIDDAIPTADALRSQNIVWVTNEQNWSTEHEAVSDHALVSGAQTFIAWPVTIRGAYMSVLGTTLKGIIAPSPNYVSYLETVGGIIAMQITRRNEINPIHKEEERYTQLDLLTRRQRETLKLMADGLTNPQIAHELGFSESTIRQETMRIYEIFGATGRADAVKMYREIAIKIL